MAIFKSDGAAIIVGFIGAIIAIVILAAASTNIVGTTATNNANESVTAPVINGTLDLLGRELVGTATVINATSGTLASGANFTVSTQTGSDGLRTVQLLTNSQAAESGYNTSTVVVNVSYEYRPDGYLNLSGARSINNLVIIVAALAILVFVLVIFVQRGTLGKFIKKL